MRFLLPCLDANDRAARCHDLLSIDRDRAALLGRSAVAAAGRATAVP